MFKVDEFLGPEERLKEAPALIFWDSRPRINHLNQHLRILTAGDDLYPAAFRGVLHGVSQKIGENLLHAVFVRFDLCFSFFKHQLELLGRIGKSESLDHVSCKRLEVKRFKS